MQLLQVAATAKVKWNLSGNSSLETTYLTWKYF